VSRGAYLLSLGLVPYGEAFDLQRSLAGAVSQGAIPETVIFLEHPPVVTLGRRTETDRELHIPEDAEVEIAETDPGVRGDTSGGGGKPAKLETGAVVRVPLPPLRQRPDDIPLLVLRLVHQLTNDAAEIARMTAPEFLASLARGLPQNGVDPGFFDDVDGRVVKTESFTDQVDRAGEDRVQVECGGDETSDFGGSCQIVVASLKRFLRQLTFCNILMHSQETDDLSALIQDGTVRSRDGNQPSIPGLVDDFPGYRSTPQ